MTQLPCNIWCIIWEGQIFSDRQSMIWKRCWSLIFIVRWPGGCKLSCVPEIISVLQNSKLSGKTHVSTSASLLNFKIVSHWPCLYISPYLSYYLPPYFINNPMNVDGLWRSVIGVLSLRETALWQLTGWLWGGSGSYQWNLQGCIVISQYWRYSHTVKWSSTPYQPVPQSWAIAMWISTAMKKQWG